MSKTLFKNMSSYRQFKVGKKDLENLSIEEEKILKSLNEVVKELAVVYDLQKKEGFYPKDTTKKELEKHSINDSQILSPFTMVYRSGKKLKAIPYHQKYAVYLKPISEKIEKAANLSSNASFKRYLKLRAKSLSDGNYREADVAWLNVKNSNIDFSIGPFERYLDKLMLIKRAFQAHVGIIDWEYSDKSNKVKDALYTFAKLTHGKDHSTEIPTKGVTIYSQKIPATSGYLAEALFTGEHFPCDLDLMQKYGSKSIIYSSIIKLKLDKIYYPIFKKLFEKRFASKYSKDLLFQAYHWNILLIELGRQLHKFAGSRERLQEMYGPIDEANAFASGIQHSKHLVVKGLLSQEKLEAIIIIHIISMLANWLIFSKNENQTLTNHILGYAIGINTYLKSGALSEKDGIFWPSFSKIFFEIEDLADKLVHLLQEGSYTQAKNFVAENSNFDNLKRLSKHLENLSVNI